MDPLDEICYLAMECELAGAGGFGDALLRAYREEMRDEAPETLAHFYKAARAVVRAKLAAWHLDDHPGAAERRRWTARARAYLRLAGRHAGRLEHP
jgi:aminoglycoside phosphotransferase family enzyme